MWLSEPTGLDERCQTLDDVLSPRRKWSSQVNMTKAKQQGNAAVLEAKAQAVTHDNPAQEIAELIPVAQTEGAQAFSPDKKVVPGKHILQGPNMTVDTLLTLVPIDRWPSVGGSSCFDIDCRKGHVDDKDHEQRMHSVIHGEKMRDRERATIVGLVRPLSVHAYSLENSGFFDVYAELSAYMHKAWSSLVSTFNKDGCKQWHDLTGDLWVAS
jgi:hypothetical protein